MDRLSALTILEEQHTLTSDIWEKAVAMMRDTRPVHVQCIKIDPFTKTVEFVMLEMTEEEGDGMCLLSPSSETLDSASSLPRGAMIRSSSMPPFGYLLKWTDLDLVGRDRVKTYPGFKITGAKALVGIALVAQILTVDTEFGTIRVYVDSQSPELEWMSENIAWLDAEEVTKIQEREYRESRDEMRRAQQSGLLGNTRVVFMS